MPEQAAAVTTREYSANLKKIISELKIFTIRWRASISSDKAAAHHLISGKRLKQDIKTIWTIALTSNTWKNKIY